MSANMFDLLSEDPIAPAKAAPVAAAAQNAKPAQRAPVGGVKKSDAAKASTSTSPQVSRGTLPGEARKDVNRGPRKQHQPRKDQEGRIRGREFDRHSGTGRPANEHKRQGAGKYNTGALKDARSDEEAAAAEAAAVPAEGATEAVAATTEEVAVVEEEKVPAEPEVKTQSIAAFKAEQAKKQKEMESTLGLATGEKRVVKADWYKPEAKPAASSGAAKPAQKEQKQAKNFVPLSQVIGEKPQFRERDGDRRGPRPDRGERSERPYGERAERSERPERTERTGGDRPAYNKNNNNNNRQQNRGPRKPKETFDATATSDRDFPAL